MVWAVGICCMGQKGGIRGDFRGWGFVELGAPCFNKRRLGGGGSLLELLPKALRATKLVGQNILTLPLQAPSLSAFFCSAAYKSRAGGFEEKGETFSSNLKPASLCVPVFPQMPQRATTQQKPESPPIALQRVRLPPQVATVPFNASVFSRRAPPLDPTL